MTDTDESEKTDEERRREVIFGDLKSKKEIREMDGDGAYPWAVAGDPEDRPVIDVSDAESTDWVAGARKIERLRELLDERTDLTDEQIDRRIEIATGLRDPPERESDENSGSDSRP